MHIAGIPYITATGMGAACLEINQLSQQIDWHILATILVIGLPNETNSGSIVNTLDNRKTPQLLS